MASTTLTLLVITGQHHEPDCCGRGVDDNATERRKAVC
jgi:hypothetical protein